MPPELAAPPPRPGYTPGWTPRAGSPAQTLSVQTTRLAVYLLCFFDYGVRGLAMPLLGVVLLLALFSINRRTLPVLWLFLPLLLITGLYVGLSYLEALPTAWTRYHDQSVIVRQALWVAVMPLLTLLGLRYGLDVLRHNARREFWICALLLTLNFVVSGMLVRDWSYTMWAYGPFGYLWAPFSIFLAVALWAGVLANGRDVVLALALFALAAMVLAESSQTKLAYLVVAGVVLSGGRLRLAQALALIVLALIIAGHVWAWRDPVAVSAFESNAGIRGLMIRHAFEAAQQSSFLGIGFGTEGIKNAYPEVGLIRLSDWDWKFLLIAPHNAFFDVLMRMGVPGLAALLFALIGLSYPVGGIQVAACRLALLTVIVFNLSVNVGLQSVFHLAGVSMMLGISQAMRAGDYAPAHHGQRFARMRYGWNPG